MMDDLWFMVPTMIIVVGLLILFGGLIAVWIDDVKSNRVKTFLLILFDVITDPISLKGFIIWLGAILIGIGLIFFNI